jgi:hypothetical protein
MIADELIINECTVHEIVTQDLDKRKVCAKLVPKNLNEGVYDVRRWDDFMRHDILTKFHKYCYRRSSNIKILPQKFVRL